MASCFYNGVLLPEIPSDVLKNYPYCWIRNNARTGYYDLFMAKSPWWQSDSTTIYTASYADGIQWYRTSITEVGSDWTFNQSWTTNGGMANESDRAILWANQNIPVGAVTATAIYFVGSSAVPDEESYKIKKDTVVGLADQVRRLCKTEATLTPAQMESKLGDLNIELMETYVISDSTEQTIYPDEGYYGFSKITVGAVNLSGGGGEDSEYPNASSGSFGYISSSEDEKVYTGKYLYGDVSLPAIPEEYAKLYPYHLLFSTTTTDCYLYMSDTMLYYDTERDALVGIEDNYTIYQFSAYAKSESWGYMKHGTFGISAQDLFWSNYSILTIDGKIHKAGSTAKPEKNEDVYTEPVETENEYIISGSDLNKLGDIAQKITGTEEPMDFDDILSALESVVS